MEDVNDIINSLGEHKSSYNLELIRIFARPLELSEEESAREFTISELKHICLNVKCRVDMWKWNPAFDYYVKFREKGRLANRSSTSCQNLLAKAVNKYKSRIEKVYPSRSIEMWRKEMARERKKANIQLLKQWSMKQATDDDLPEVIYVEESEPDVICIEIESATESDGLLTQYLQPSQSTNDNEAQRVIQVDEEPSMDSEDVNNLDIDTEICNVFEMNTASIEIWSDVQHEEVVSSTFEEFANDVISTSTQSQKVE